MKRFGLRALAGTLATLMVVSAFAPAKAASAADDILLIAPNPNALKTLYITEDMVDEDGEIVISGGSYDRVVVAKEVAAKDIYFDQVTVGEMVVESGGESRIQLWEVDAEQVTVQEPEFEALSLLDIKDLLKDEETRDIALQMYKESKEKDAKTKKAAPKIVTKEDAQVETLVARANVTLDLAEGEVSEVALEGSEKVDRAKVTLKNYNGDVSFKGTEGKSNMTLNNVDSRIKTLKVEESNANNYFSVNARNSVVLKAEVAGNARFALNALTGALEVTEEATAANITLLNTIEEMNIAGDNAVIDVAPCGRVETAAITGDKANVSGSGTLVAVEITGEGAYVSTFGTDVEGENTYVPPVYVEPVYDSWSEDFSDAEINENLNKDMNGGTYTYNEEGYGVASSVHGWEGLSVTLNNKDNGSAATFVVSLKAKKIGGTASQLRLTTKASNCGAAHMTPVSLTDAWQTIKSDKISVPAGSSVIVMFAPTDNADTLDLAVDDVLVQRYTEWTEPVAKEPVIPTGAYTFDKLELVKAWNVSGVLNDNMGVALTYTDNYSQAFYMVPDAIDVSKLESITLNGVDGSGYLIRLLTEAEYATYAGSGGSDGANDSPTVSTVGKNTKYFIIFSYGAQTLTVDSVSFNVSGSTPSTPSAPEGGTKCGPVTEWEIQLFKDQDLRKYAGTTVTFTVDMIKVGGTENAQVHAQLNNSINYTTNPETNEATGAYTGLAWGVAITDTWQTLTYTYDVPEEFGDDAHAAKDPIYFGFRTISNTADYSPYTFYYKNYKFVGTPVGGGEKITEFYVAKDVAFNHEEVIDSNGNIVAQLEALNLAGDNLVNTLPTALAGDAASYKTLEGIMSKIDYFEFSVTLTEGTPKEGLDDGIYWAPQAQIQAQSTNYSEGTWNLGLTQEQNATLCVNLGQATESNPKTGTGKLYTEYFEGWTSKDQYTLNMLQIQFLNAELGTFVSGTYSIKAVLK